MYVSLYSNLLVGRRNFAVYFEVPSSDAKSSCFLLLSFFAPIISRPELTEQIRHPHQLLQQGETANAVSVRAKRASSHASLLPYCVLCDMRWSVRSILPCYCLFGGGSGKGIKVLQVGRSVDQLAGEARALQIGR